MGQQITDNTELKRKVGGVAGTILFHIILILLLWLAVLKTPIPPFPDAGGGGGGGLGIEVNLGNSDYGMGNDQENISFPEFKEPAKNIINPDPVNIKSANDISENVITDETNTENATSLKSTKDNKSTKNEIKSEEPKLNTSALFKKINGDGSTNKGGNQGDVNGNPNSSNYAKGGGSGNGQGSGNGSGIGQGSGSGTGGGNGSGTGSGTGSGKGPGISFSLNGRSAKSLPKPEYISNEQGSVVVKIWVNNKGEVTRVEAGQRGTTTSDRGLWKMAEMLLCVQNLVLIVMLLKTKLVQLLINLSA